MESRAPAVVAVVVTTGPGPGLEAALASIVAQDYEELSLLVVANGLDEHVAERVAAVAPLAFVRVLDQNRGFAAACNEASLMVEGSAFFLFCHDDVRLDTDCVGLMVEAAFRANAGIVSPKFVHYEDPLVLAHVGQTCDRYGVVRDRVEPGEIDHGQQDLERDVFVAPGGVTLVRTDLFRTLRGFDPMIPLIGEDLDLCWRAQVAGARVIVAPQARVAHRETIVTGERVATARGTRNASRQLLQRRHQLLVAATGWGVGRSLVTILTILLMDLMELALALVGRDRDRVGAIVGSWTWLLRNRKRVSERRKQRQKIRVLKDAQLLRLQDAGASRLKRFFLVLVREGLESARGILPEPLTEMEGPSGETPDGVGFAAAFAEDESFDEVVGLNEEHVRPSRFLTSFRAQAMVIVFVALLWAIGARNLVATHLPLVGRLAPLDSWWSTWRHFFASWSPNGVGSGAPGMPGYGILGFAGTFVLGRMGILPRLALIAAVPLGAIGVARLLKGRVSNRARLIAAVAYLALPTGLNMIGQGRVDVLAVVAGLPFIVRRLFDLLNIPGFRSTPYSEPVPFGHRGWRTSEAGQRMSAIMVIALVTAMAPATMIVVVLVIVGVILARLIEPDENRYTPWRLLGSILINVAIFLLPLTVNTVIAGRRAWGVFGAVRGPWTVPSFESLLRGVDGGIGNNWWGWLWPAVALAALLLARGPRRVIASKVAMVATLTLLLMTLSDHHLLGTFAPDLDVLLVLYGVMLAVLVGVGVAAIENDVRSAGFGWRQVTAGVSVTAMVLAPLAWLVTLGSGRFDLPTSSVAESLATLAPPTATQYRVLWLGDPSILPVPGWSVAPGLSAATSMDGLPGGNTLFSPPSSGATDAVIAAVKTALEGRTVNLGELLAPAGISAIVVMDASAPQLAGVQSSPVRSVPASLVPSLNAQTDLALELTTTSVQVYANAQFSGIVRERATKSSPWVSVLSPITHSGSLVGGGQVESGTAPAGLFSMVVNGHALPRSSLDGWAGSYVVPSSTTSVVGTLTLHEFPWNGLLALFTLSMWSIIWLGFGWVHRLEWLFAGRQRGQRRSRRVQMVRVHEDVDA
ncbi:MAG: glycosyltransferase family 2 protein [Acidimicrobiaceae bacterium]|nr:glycosyltransferase family 2 protein [Acidimicrobiaceae bacterium]